MARLIGRTGKVRGTDVPLAEVLTIGSAPENEVRIESRTVSRRHAQIIRTGTEYYVEDLGSRNGTFLNGQRVKRFPVRHLDVLSIGPDTDLIFMESGTAAPAAPRPLSLRGTILWLDGALTGQIQEFAPGRSLILGRTFDMPLEAISRRHAALTITDDGATVEDLGSANGTWVNGAPISGVRPLADGDEVSLGNLVRCRVSLISGPSPITAQFLEGGGAETMVFDQGSGDSTEQTGRGPVLEVPRSAPAVSAGVPPPSPPARPPAPVRVEQAPPEPRSPEPRSPEPPPQELPPQELPPPELPPPAGATIVAPRTPAKAPPPRIASAPRPEVPPPPPGGTIVAPRGPAVPPSFSAPAPGQDPDTFTPPREPAGGLPAAIASRARAARIVADVTSASPVPAPPRSEPVPKPVRETPDTGKGPIDGARFEGARTFTLPQGTFEVGRQKDCAVYLELRDVGRKHARLIITGQDVSVEDLASGNGTFVDDVRISGTAVVRDGGTIRFATVEYTVTYLRNEG